MPAEEADQPDPVQLTSTATVTINVEDGDDLNPIFMNTPYMASVIENEELVRALSSRTITKIHLAFVLNSVVVLKVIFCFVECSYKCCTAHTGG